MKTHGKEKIFVLDTSVILFNHASILSFQDNDVAIPITVLEELDRFKKGHDNMNFEAREFIRIIDKLSENNRLNVWTPLGENLGNLMVIMDENNPHDDDALKIFNADKGDHRIINAALNLKREHPNKRVILVTKDINLRIKAKAIALEAEDFKTDKIENIENLYTGKREIDNIDQQILDRLKEQQFIDPKEIGLTTIIPNQYLRLSGKDGETVLAYVNGVTHRVEFVPRITAMHISPRNDEQAFALHAVLNDDVKLVSLQGVAGTGKTLLALAGALEQRSKFKQVFLSRPIVPLSNRDLGFLPGDIKEKVEPYMQPLYDNLKFIKYQFAEKNLSGAKIDQMLENDKLVIEPLAYIRGRSLPNICFIVDEAQNLTPHEVKTIITRAGENTKIIFTGDIHQIDTPYLDTQSNGLSYMIYKIMGEPLFAHIQLEKGERSALANLAGDKL